jgi:hypothetical protein
VRELSHEIRLRAPGVFCASKYFFIFFLRFWDENGVLEGFFGALSFFLLTLSTDVVKFSTNVEGD